MARTILITGASTGLGLGATRAFAKRQDCVIATVRTPEDAERVEAQGRGIHAVICDVTREDHVAALPDRVRGITGEGVLDGLVNNAGVMSPPGPVEFQKLETVRAQFEVNLFGMMAVTTALLPLLGTAGPARKSPGRIVNLSSIEGRLASPYISAYATSKYAIEGFSHSLRRELRLFGINVIILAPGGVKTEMWRKYPLNVEPLVGTAYENSFRKMAELTRKMENEAATADEVGEFLARIFQAPRPRARYTYAKSFMDGPWPALLPHLWYDAMLGMLLGLRQNC